MSYVIVKDRQTQIGTPFVSFDVAFERAQALFGKDVRKWLELNLRIERYAP